MGNSLIDKETHDTANSRLHDTTGETSHETENTIELLSMKCDVLKMSNIIT